LEKEETENIRRVTDLRPTNLSLIEDKDDKKTPHLRGSYLD